MAWDTETSVEVLAPGTSGIVGVTGGSGNYHWSVRGNGFALSADGRLRDGSTDTTYVYIYALSSACGYCSIEVTDGCSVLSGGVRSTDGSWSEVGRFFPPDIAKSLWAVYSIYHSTCGGHGSSVQAWQYNGKYSMQPVSSSSYPPGSTLQYDCIYFAAHEDIAGEGFLDPIIGKFWWPFCDASQNMGSYWRIWTTAGPTNYFKILEWGC